MRSQNYTDIGVNASVKASFAIALKRGLKRLKGSKWLEEYLDLAAPIDEAAILKDVPNTLLDRAAMKEIFKIVRANDTYFRDKRLMMRYRGPRRGPLYLNSTVPVGHSFAVYCCEDYSKTRTGVAYDVSDQEDYPERHRSFKVAS